MKDTAMITVLILAPLVLFWLGYLVGKIDGRREAPPTTPRVLGEITGISIGPMGLEATGRFIDKEEKK